MRLTGPQFRETDKLEAQASELPDTGHSHPINPPEPPNAGQQVACDIVSTVQMQAHEIEALPDWQKAFMLGPTVRFTRTPEKTISRRGAPSGPEAEGEAVASHAVPEAVIPPMAAPAVQEISEITFTQRHDGDALSTSIASFLSPEPGARNLVGTLDQALRERRATFARETVEPVLVAVAPPQPEAVIDAPVISTERQSPIANLPDHLFFEVMSLGEATGEEFALTPPPPPKVEQRPVFVAQRPLPTYPKQPVRPEPVRVALRAPVIRQPIETLTKRLVEEIPVGPSPLDLYRSITLRQAGDDAAPNPVVPPVEDAPVIAAAAPVVPEPVIPEPVLVAPVIAETVIEAPAPAVAPVVPVKSTRQVVMATRAISPIRPFNTEPLHASDDYEFPSIELLQAPVDDQISPVSQESLEQSAGLLESVLEDFGIRGEIIDVRPGPVVTLYEFAPAPGVKSSRVIGLSDDIARSMSALSARVAVVPGRNVIGIELPNPVRETVYLRELIESGTYAGTGFRLPLCLGKTIGGEPVVAELAKMPHLLVAGTTGSGKSVAVNTMILSLIYRLRPDQCRLIMVDPKMLELSAYDGIPHLLTPVVTDPKKAVLALKWAVREMEDRYRKMSRLGVRNIDGFNARVAAASASGEVISISVQVGFDRQTGEPINEQQDMDLTPLPYIVVIVDEMADLMMVAGKEIEGAIQRLAQMARAAGIHLIMATQRPSVDVITGTIKANFPTRISFQVTSKIDSRTILGEQGAENLLGQGDMLHMVGGGRIARVHGPFVSDQEVERIVAHLKTQGQPLYLGSVTEDEEGEEVEEEDQAVFDRSAISEEDRDEMYEQAIKVVMRDKKCSTSYIQRRLSIGYNRAASLVERMEKDGLVGPANHVGKREILDQRGQPTVAEEPEQ